MTPASTPSHKGVLNILDATGHTALAWDTADPATLADVEAKFNALVGPSTELRVRPRYAAFRVDAPGGAGAQITQFDPNAREIILVPPLAGG